MTGRGPITERFEDVVDQSQLRVLGTVDQSGAGTGNQPANCETARRDQPIRRSVQDFLLIYIYRLLLSHYSDHYIIKNSVQKL